MSFDGAILRVHTKPIIKRARGIFYVIRDITSLLIADIFKCLRYIYIYILIPLDSYMLDHHHINIYTKPMIKRARGISYVIRGITNDRRHIHKPRDGDSQ